MIGSLVDGRYRVLAEIGAGAMGKVLEAEHTGTGRRVALKVILREALRADEATVRRFQREARAAGSIETQHIVQILDTGIDPETGAPYLAMELLAGEDAAQLVRRVGPLRPDVALRIVAQACQGLRKAHEAGVIHRDIKPANLFLAEGEEGDIVVKILDFGVAKARAPDGPVDQALTRTGALLGSPLYMSPEQARGHRDLDHRSDLWSLGVVFYQLLAGRTPLADIDALGELIIAICSDPPPPLQRFAPWIEPEIARLVHTALNLDVRRRFQTAADMLAVLRALLPDGDTRLGRHDLAGVAEDARRLVAAPYRPSHADTGDDLVREATGATPLARASPPPAAAAARSMGADAPRAATADGVVRTGVAGAGPHFAEGSRRSRLAIGALVTILLGAGLWMAYRRSASEASSAARAAASASGSAAPIGARSAAARERALVVLGDSFSGYASFRRKSFEEALGREGVAISYAEELDQDRRARKLDAGEADLVLTTLDQMIVRKPRGKIVALVDTTAGADAVVLNTPRHPELGSLGALARLGAAGGRRPRIAYAAGTPSEYLALLLDARFDSFDLASFEIRTYADAAEIWRDLGKPEADLAVAVLWEPYVTRARKAGLEVALSSADLPEAIVDVLVASERLLARGDVVGKVVAAHYRQADAGIVSPAELVRQIAEDGGLEAGEAQAVASGIRFFTAPRALAWMSDGTLGKRIRATASILALAGRLEQPPREPEALYVVEHVAQAAKATRALVDGVRESDPALGARLEGREAAAAGGELEARALATAPVLGHLGVVVVDRRSLNEAAKQAVERAAAGGRDFSAARTVVLLRPTSRDQSAEPARLVEAELRARGVAQRIASLAPAPAGTAPERVAIDLVRAP